MPVQFPAPSAQPNQYYSQQDIPLLNISTSPTSSQPYRRQSPMVYERPKKDFADKHVKMTAGCAPAFGALGGAVGQIAQHYGSSNAASWGASVAASHPAGAATIGAVALLGAAAAGGGGDICCIGGGGGGGSCEGIGRPLANTFLVTPAISMPSGAIGNLAANMAATHGLSYGAAAGIGAGVGCASGVAGTAIGYGVAKGISSCISSSSDEDESY